MRNFKRRRYFKINSFNLLKVLALKKKKNQNNVFLKIKLTLSKYEDLIE